MSIMIKRLLLAPVWGLAFAIFSYGMMFVVMVSGTLSVAMIPGLDRLAEPFGTFCGVGLMTAPFIALFTGALLSVFGKLPYTR